MADFLPDPGEFWAGNGGIRRHPGPPAQADQVMKDGRYLIRRPRCPLCGSIIGQGCNVKVTRRPKSKQDGEPAKTYPEIFCDKYKKAVPCEYV